jgi:hypothetical protein
MGVELPWLVLTKFGRFMTYRRIKGWLIMTMFYAVPFSILLVVNTRIIIAIRR